MINKKMWVSLMERRSLAPIIRRRDYQGGQKIEGGIVIDDVTVNLTIEDVNVGYGTDIIDDAAGILLKGKAKLNLTVKGIIH